MNQFFAGGFAVIVAFLIWGLNKKSSRNFNPLLQKNFLQYQAQESMSLVNTAPKSTPNTRDQSQETFWESPKTEKERINLRENTIRINCWWPR